MSIDSSIPASSSQKPVESIKELDIDSYLNQETESPLAAVSKKISYWRTRAKGVSQTNRHHAIWHFLTLGIPSLLEAFAVFCEGIIYRAKTGLAFSVRFHHHHFNADKVDKLIQFHKFKHSEKKSLLKSIEIQKANSLIQGFEKACELAQLHNNQTALKFNMQHLKSLQDLLQKSQQPLMTRKQLYEHDWQALDLIDYEIVKDHLSNLTTLFNEEWFRNTRSFMLDHFGIDYHESLVAESLSLSLAYIEGLEGQSISLPLYDPVHQAYRSVSYTIKSLMIGDNLPCYILECKEDSVPPWLVIRGTQRFTKVLAHGKEQRVGSFESILTDLLDRKCITRNVLNKAIVRRPIVKEGDKYVQKESVGDIFRQWHAQGKQVMLCGHSLGGTIVNALTVEFNHQIQRAYAFSGAGVSEEIAEHWNILCEQAEQSERKELLPQLINFDHEGDLVPSGGRRLIGLHVSIESLVPVLENSIHECHIRSHLNRDFQICMVDNECENNKLSRSFCERIRIIAGDCLRVFLKCFSGKYIPEWWHNRSVYRRQAAFHRKMRPLLAQIIT